MKGALLALVVVGCAVLLTSGVSASSLSRRDQGWGDIDDAEGYAADSLERSERVEEKRSSLRVKLTALKLRRASYLRRAARYKKQGDRDTRRAANRERDAAAMKQLAQAAAAAGSHNKAKAARRQSRAISRRAKRHRKSARRHYRLAQRYYKKANGPMLRRERRLQARLSRGLTMLARLRLKGARGLMRANRLVKRVSRASRRAVRFLKGGRKRNCSNPTLTRRKRGGPWVPRRRSFAVRRMVQDKATGVWYRNSQRKYKWVNCKWVLSRTYVQKVRIRANTLAGNKEAYKGLLATEDRIKKQLVAKEKVAAALKERNAYLERLAGSSVRHQRNLLNQMVTAKATKLYGQFTRDFMEHYLNAGAGARASGASILGRGAGNPAAASKYPLGRRDRLDPQPGSSEFPYSGRNEDPSDDVAPPPSSGSARRNRLSRVP
jgi:hypothetical protein